MSTSDWHCPNCKAESIQKLSVIFEGGISQTTATTTGSAIGMGGGGLAFGSGSAVTKGTSQTALSKRAQPPTKFRYRWALPFLLLAYMGKEVPVGAAIFALPGILWISFAAFYNFKKWPPKMAFWRRSYLCHRCDHTFQM